MGRPLREVNRPLPFCQSCVARGEDALATLHEYPATRHCRLGEHPHDTAELAPCYGKETGSKNVNVYSFES